MPLDTTLPRFSANQCSVCGEELPELHTHQYCDECDPFLRIVTCALCGLKTVEDSKVDESGHRCPAPVVTHTMMGIQSHPPLTDAEVEACFRANSLNPTAEQCPGTVAGSPETGIPPEVRS